MCELKLFSKTSKDYKQYKCLRGAIIILEGSIGVGKTTLGNKLCEFLNKIGLDARFYKEFVNESLLKLYINNMKKHAFSFQSIMARERRHIYLNAVEYSKTGGISIVDRGLIGDYVFAKMQKDKNFIDDDEWKVYVDLVSTELPEPSMVLYMRAIPEISFLRMKHRNNESEKSGYTLKYFEDLHKTYDEVIKNCKYNHTTLDWNKDLQEITDDKCRSVFDILLQLQ